MGQEEQEAMQAVPRNKGDGIQSSKLIPNRAPSHFLPKKECLHLEQGFLIFKVHINHC